MNYIERNAERGFGQPVLVGRRLTVLDVVKGANGGIAIYEFLDDFEVSMEEFKAAVVYCGSLACKEISAASDRYCDGCLLRSISEGWTSLKDDFDQIEDLLVSRDGLTVIVGNMEAAEDEEFGVMGWVVAQDLARRLSFE